MKAKHFACLAAAAAVLSAPFWSGIVAQAATTSNSTAKVYVSISGSDVSGTGSSESPYQTINHAVSVAPVHSTIVVEPGTYNEEVKITRDVTLESDSSKADAVSNTIIDATGQDTGIFVDGQDASGAVINGFTVKNASNHGIWVRNTSHVTVENNMVENNGINPTKTKTVSIAENKPILLDGTSYSVVSHNLVKGNKADGGVSITDFGMFDPGAPMPTTPPSGPPPANAPAAAPGIGNVVIDNDIDSNAGGCGVVVAAYNPGGGVVNNQVIGNTVNKIVAGVVVAADVPRTVAKDNVVSNNTITNNFIPGVIVHSNTPGDVVDGNVITGNTISGNGPDKEVKDAKPTGIALIGAVNPVTNTTVTNNIISNEGIGVWAENAPSTHLSDNQSASDVAVPVFGLQPDVVVELNGKVAAELPKATVGDTAYVPLFDVIQMFKAADHLPIHWNGHELSLKVPYLAPVAPKNLGTGNMDIMVNGVTIAKVKGFYASTPYGLTTYMSVSGLAQMDASLGYNSTFNGVTWSMSKKSSENSGQHSVSVLKNMC